MANTRFQIENGLFVSDSGENANVVIEIPSKIDSTLKVVDATTLDNTLAVATNHLTVTAGKVGINRTLAQTGTATDVFSVFGGDSYLDQNLVINENIQTGINHAYAQGIEVTISNIVVLDNIATITTATNHGFSSNQRVFISGTTGGFDGSAKINVTAVNQFEIDTLVSNGTYSQTNAAKAKNGVVDAFFAGLNQEAIPVANSSGGIQTTLQIGDPVILSGANAYFTGDYHIVGGDLFVYNNLVVAQDLVYSGTIGYASDITATLSNLTIGDPAGIGNYPFDAIYTNTLYITDDTTVGGIFPSGVTSVNLGNAGHRFKIYANTINASAATTLGGTLGVTGATTLSNTLTVSGDNATSLGGTLGVTGATTLSNALTVSGAYATSLGGTLGVTGATTLSNTLTVSGDNATSLGGTLGVTGATTLNNALTVSGTHATSLGGTLGVTGLTTLSANTKINASAAIGWSNPDFSRALLQIGGADIGAAVSNYADEFLIYRSNASTGLTIGSGLGAGHTSIHFGNNATAAYGAIWYVPGSNTMHFSTGSTDHTTEDLLINSSGNVKVVNYLAVNTDHTAGKALTVGGAAEFKDISSFAEQITSTKQNAAPFVLDSTAAAYVVTYLNADKVDDLDAAAFLRSNADDALEAHILVHNEKEIRFANSSNLDDETWIRRNSGGGWRFQSGVNGIYFDQVANTVFNVTNSAASNIFQINPESDTKLYYNGSTTLRTGDGLYTGAVIIGDVVPSSNNSGNIGTPTRIWNDGAFTNLYVNSTLDVRGAIDLSDDDFLRFGLSDDHILYYNEAGTQFIWHQNVESPIIFTATNNDENITLNPETGNISIEGTYTGNGSGLTNLNASNIDNGTIPAPRLPGVYLGTTLVDLTRGSGSLELAAIKLTSVTSGSEIHANIQSTSANQYKIPFLNTTTGVAGSHSVLKESDATLTYQPSTQTLKVTNLDGTASNAINAVNASYIATADNNTNAWYKMPFLSSDTGNVAVYNHLMQFNPNTQQLVIPAQSTSGAGLILGTNNIYKGYITLYGGSASTGGGVVTFYNDADNDGTIDYWQLYSSGTNFSIGNNTTNNAAGQLIVEGSIVPAAGDTFNLGTSDTRWVSGYFKNSVNIGINDNTFGSLSIYGDSTTNGGSLYLYSGASNDTSPSPNFYRLWPFGGNLYLQNSVGSNASGAFYIQQHTYPHDTNTFQLGSASTKWKDVYATNIYADQMTINGYRSYPVLVQEIAENYGGSWSTSGGAPSAIDPGYTLFSASNTGTGFTNGYGTARGSMSPTIPVTSKVKIDLTPTIRIARLHEISLTYSDQYTRTYKGVSGSNIGTSVIDQFEQGGGSSEMQLLINRNGSTIWTSDFVQLSTAGQGFAVVASIVDESAPPGATYTIQAYVRGTYYNSMNAKGTARNYNSANDSYNNLKAYCTGSSTFFENFSPNCYMWLSGAGSWGIEAITSYRRLYYQADATATASSVSYRFYDYREEPLVYLESMYGVFTVYVGYQ